MIKLGNTVFLDNYIKGIKKRPDCMKVYFTDNTAKCLYKTTDQNDLEKYIDNMGFIRIDNCSFNPQNIKGFELERDSYTDDEYIKIYFPDNTATKVMLDEDGFDNLVAWFSDREF